MTDLGNGLFAVSVPIDAEKFHFVNLDTKYLCFFGADTDNIRLNVSTLDTYEILGTVTKDNISFDFEPYCEIYSKHEDVVEFKTYNYDLYTLNEETAFRSLLSSKGLHFENPYGDKEPNFLCRRNKWQQAQNNLIDKLVIIKKV